MGAMKSSRTRIRVIRCWITRAESKTFRRGTSGKRGVFPLVSPHLLSYVFSFVLFLAASLHAFGQAAPPLDYYDSAIGQTGAALKSALHEIIKGHTVLPYTATPTDTWDALKVLDEDPANAANVLLLYSGYSVPKAAQWTGSSGIWDREHLWPQSFGLVALNANSRARTDVFNLRPCDVSVNSSRGNKYYDETTPPGSSYPDAPLSSYDNDSWEPRPEEKGLIARSLFYMAVRYAGTDPDVPDLELSDTPNPALYRFGKLSTLLAWHRQFSVTTAERERNQRIYSDYQHNRNPFIDHPEFADIVFATASPLDAWRALHFNAVELANPAQSGDTADLDHDGFATVLEYTFHSDPRHPQTTPLLTASVVTIGDNHFLEVIFPHNRFATDVSISYEGSEDCTTWAPLTPDSISAGVTDFETEQWTVRFSAPAPQFFLRLRVD